MKNIQIKNGGNTIEGIWNEKCYNSKKGNDFKRIYIDNNEIHITNTQYEEIRTDNLKEMKKGIEKLTINEKLELLKSLSSSFFIDMENEWDKSEDDEKIEIKDLEMFESDFKEIEEYAKQIRDDLEDIKFNTKN